MNALTEFDAVLDSLDGRFSVWCGRPGAEPGHTRQPDLAYYPASTMKIGVMAGAYRLADAGELDLDAEIPIHNDFASAVSGRFSMDRGYDSDPSVWDRMGGTAPLRWLIRRMIVRSSNLATNLVLERTGYAAAQDAYTACGATDSVTRRGIEDAAAREGGADNFVTAADLAKQLSAIEAGTLATPRSCHEMIDVLQSQELNTDLARGLPDGARVALKNGWVEGIRHSAAIVYPDDAPAFVLAACGASPLADTEDSDAGNDEVCRVYGRLAAAAWECRHDLPG